MLNSGVGAVGVGYNGILLQLSSHQVITPSTASKFQADSVPNTQTCAQADTNTQIHKYKHTNTQIHKYKYTNT